MKHTYTNTLWTVFLTLTIAYLAVFTGEATHALSRREARRAERLAEQELTRTLQRVEKFKSSAQVAFGCAIQPFGFTPNWGAMTSDLQLNRNFCDINPEELVPPPPYILSDLTVSLAELNKEKTPENIRRLTAKLFYSTRHFGAYNLDSGEYQLPNHPGIDFKMPEGTLVRSIAGGVIHAVNRDKDGLGNHVIVEHVLPDTSQIIFSIYGHLDLIVVEEGDQVSPGQFLGTVGSSGNVTLPHLHLQIDTSRNLPRHKPYVPAPDTEKSEWMKWTIHPIDFIQMY